MNTATGPITATTALSVLLHGVVLLAVVLFVDHSRSSGTGLEIELIRSLSDAKDQVSQTEKKSKPLLNENALVEVNKNTIETSIQEEASTVAILTATDNEEKLADVSAVTEAEVVVKERIESFKQIAKSTNASGNLQTLISLLHQQISSNKEYPYIARRQRREGVATVTFVLLPNGQVLDTHLTRSSQTAALDRAALSAVENIEPLERAADYIDSAEQFTIDVVFSLI